LVAHPLPSLDRGACPSSSQDDQSARGAAPSHPVDDDVVPHRNVGTNG